MALRDWFRRRRRLPEGRALADTFRRALLAVLAANYDEAERLISEAVQADSEDVEPYRALARLYLLRGEVGRAIRIHQNLLLRRDLPPGQRNAVLAELAEDFRQGGFLKRALASYQELVEHEPRNAAALRALAELLSETGEHAQALAVARRLARVEGRDPAGESRLQLRLARAEHAEGRHDVARRAVKRALRRDPDNADARLLLGELEAERGRSKAALAAWRELARRGGVRAVEVHPKLEASFAAVDRARDYETFLRGLLEERPDDAVARMALSRTLASRGETDSAILELRRAIDTHPRELPPRLALGRLLLDSGRDADALKAYDELLAWLEAPGRSVAWEEES